MFNSDIDLGMLEVESWHLFYDFFLGALMFTPMLTVASF